MIDLARRRFTFLDDSAAKIEIVAGDARLSLAREEAQRFDVLVVDAFASDAIPVHLLTLEAFELYGRHLAPDGVLALHVTTRHIDLGPLVRGMAQEMGMQALEIRSAAEEERGLLAARWILITSDPELLTLPRIRAAGIARGGLRSSSSGPTTGNLLQVL
jgi:spermidine synthase